MNLLSEVRLNPKRSKQPQLSDLTGLAPLEKHCQRVSLFAKVLRSKITTVKNSNPRKNKTSDQDFIFRAKVPSNADKEINNGALGENTILFYHNWSICRQTLAVGS